MEYYLEDPNVPLPPEDADSHIYNDEYYLRQAGIEESEERSGRMIKWQRLHPDDSFLRARTVC